MPIDPPGAAPIFAQLTGQHDVIGIFFVEELFPLQDLMDLVEIFFAQFKFCFNRGTFCTGTDEGRFPASTHDHLQSIHDNGFSSTGFPGEDHQSGLKRQLELVYDGKVFDP